jgi:hypothetical protein
LPREKGIFTPTSISPSPWLRQWGCRYAIRAGRNLPDKEFRSVLLLARPVQKQDRRAGRFRRPPHVAMRLGPYHLEILESGIWSLGIPIKGFLLIVRASRIVTVKYDACLASTGGYSDFPAYSRILLRLAFVNLRTVQSVTPSIKLPDTSVAVISAARCMSPCRSDYIIPTMNHRRVRRVVSEDDQKPSISPRRRTVFFHRRSCPSEFPESFARHSD